VLAAWCQPLILTQRGMKPQGKSNVADMKIGREGFTTFLRLRCVRKFAWRLAQACEFLMQPGMHTGSIDGARTRRCRKQLSEPACYLFARAHDSGLQCGFANAQSFDGFGD
jgi:hypothetical protein